MSPEKQSTCFGSILPFSRRPKIILYRFSAKIRVRASHVLGPTSYVLVPLLVTALSFLFLITVMQRESNLLERELSIKAHLAFRQKGFISGRFPIKKKNPGSPGVVIVIINSQSRSSKHRARPMSSSC